MEFHQQLALLRQLVPSTVEGEAWSDFSAGWKSFSLPRKEVITAAGETEGFLYFVTAGAQRIVHFLPEGQEATVLFTYPPSFGGVLDSFLLQKPAAYYYETLSKSEFLRMSYQQLAMLRKNHQSIDRFINEATVAAMGGLMHRMVDLQSLDNTAKLQALLKRSPQILQHIPHKYLANYLGMDPTNFSKLLNSVTFS